MFIQNWNGENTMSKVVKIHLNDIENELNYLLAPQFSMKSMVLRYKAMQSLKKLIAKAKPDGRKELNDAYKHMLKNWEVDDLKDIDEMMDFIKAVNKGELITKHDLN